MINTEVESYMNGIEFTVVRGVTAGRCDSITYYRKVDRLGVFDTHGENFLTDGGIVTPIDALIVK